MRKFKKIIYAFSAIAMFSICFTSCGDDEPDNTNPSDNTVNPITPDGPDNPNNPGSQDTRGIYGTWEFSENDSEGVNEWTFTFNENDSFTAVNNDHTDIYNISGTYSLTANEIQMKINSSNDDEWGVGETIQWNYVLDGDFLTLDKITLVKKGSNGNAAILKLNPMLYGVWVRILTWPGEKENTQLTINEDGSFEFVDTYYENNELDEQTSFSGTWLSTDKTLVLSVTKSSDSDFPIGSVIREHYTVTGNTLNLTSAGGTFKKEK